MEKEREEELNQKEFPFMDETPPTKLFPFMAEFEEESTDKKEKENGKRKD